MTKLGQLHSPALLMQEVFAYGCHKGESYILVTGLLGSDLLKLASATGTHTYPNVLVLAEQALVLLEELHRASFLHRDIKPENLVSFDTVTLE